MSAIPSTEERGRTKSFHDEEKSSLQRRTSFYNSKGTGAMSEAAAAALSSSKRTSSFQILPSGANVTISSISSSNSSLSSSTPSITSTTSQQGQNSGEQLVLNGLTSRAKQAVGGVRQIRERKYTFASGHGIDLEEGILRKWFTACTIGDSTIILEMLKKEPVLSKLQDSYFGYSCLHWAAKHGNLSLSSKLLASGADVNAQSKSGFTPLHFASAHGHTQLIKKLKESGANDELMDNAGRSPWEVMRVHKYQLSIKEPINVNLDRNKEQIAPSSNSTTTRDAIPSSVFASLPFAPATPLSASLTDSPPATAGATLVQQMILKPTSDYSKPVGMSITAHSQEQILAHRQQRNVGRKASEEESRSMRQSASSGNLHASLEGSNGGTPVSQSTENLLMKEDSSISAKSAVSKQTSAHEKSSNTLMETDIDGEDVPSSALTPPAEQNLNVSQAPRSRASSLNRAVEQERQEHEARKEKEAAEKERAQREESEKVKEKEKEKEKEKAINKQKQASSSKDGKSESKTPSASSMSSVGSDGSTPKAQRKEMNWVRQESAFDLEQKLKKEEEERARAEKELLKKKSKVSLADLPKHELPADAISWRGNRVKEN